MRGIYLSLDPYMRGRISGARSYAKPVEIGAVMEGRVVGQVVRSRDPGFREGDYVYGGYGWQLYSAVPAKDLIKLDPDEAPLSTALGVLGMPGLTAYVGLSEIGRPQRGETVVVSAASGAVGAVAGQLAKRAGARVIGIAGGADKCRYVEGELGFDACIDHRSADLGAALDRACPKGIDVYWENVGGAVQQAVFPRLNDFGRMVMCGMVSEYNDVEPRPGPNLDGRGAQAAQDPGLHRQRPVATLSASIARWRRRWCAVASSNTARTSSRVSTGRPRLLSACCKAGISASSWSSSATIRRQALMLTLGRVAGKRCARIFERDRDICCRGGLPAHHLDRDVIQRARLSAYRTDGCEACRARRSRLPRLRHAGNGGRETGAGQGPSV